MTNLAARGVAVLAVILVAQVAAAQTFYVPAAAHNAGVGGAQWRTDLEAKASLVGPATFRVDLLRSNQDNSTPTHQDFSLDPGVALRLNDLLGSSFGYTGSGALRVEVTGGAVLLQSRTYNDDPDGTYGQLIPAFADGAALESGQTGALIQLTANTDYRTNLGFLNVTAAYVTVEAWFYLADRTSLGTLHYDLEPYEHLQITDVFTGVTSSAVDDGYALVRAVTGQARFFTYASVVDNDSGDAIFVPTQLDEDGPPPPPGVVADHWAAMAFDDIPGTAIAQARASFDWVYYGHTSHGSQVVTGLSMLESESSTYAMPSFAEEDGDLGTEGDLTWVDQTRAALDLDPSYDMVIWSWCGGVSDNTEEGVDAYLHAMSQLEEDFPSVVFVYMTGHLDGSGPEENLYRRDDQIRTYCQANGKVLFDFADIESYDPDGTYYPWGSDWCEWCTDWCESNSCPSCDDCAHSQCVNCYQKGKAFWWMLARLSGWGS